MEKDVRQTARELLERRYPALAFFLQISREGEIDEVEEIPPLPSLRELDALSLIYIYGLRCSGTYPLLKEWLSSNRERDLVFIEESPDALQKFLQKEEAPTILQNPQVHIRFNMDPHRLGDFLQECAANYPVEHMEITAPTSYRKKFGKRFHRMRLDLMRFTTVQHALFIDNFYEHLFFKNSLDNFRHAPGAFYANRLKGIFPSVPAVICGAGPSLARDLKTLKNLENHLLVFAGGSAVTALSKNGIVPHFCVGVDPNFEEFLRFKESPIFEAPLLYMNRLHSRVFQTRNGPNGYIHAPAENSQGSIWIEKQLGIFQEPTQGGFDVEGMSVTTTCIEFASFMGCSPIILLGVDLAFTDQKRYLPGVIPDPTLFLGEKGGERVSEKLLKRRDIHGKWVYTSVKWIMESAAIARFAKHNHSTEFFNATSGGIGFKGIPNLALSEIPLKMPRDFRGRLHQVAQCSPLPVTSTHIEDALQNLLTSLKKGERYTSAILDELEKTKERDCDPENGKIVFYQMEFEALDIYISLLQRVDRELPSIFKRRYRIDHWQISNAIEKGKSKREELDFKWSFFRKLIAFYIDLLTSLNGENFP